MTSGGKLNYVHYTGKTKARDNESHQEAMIKVRERREMKEGPSQARSAHNHVRGVSGSALWV